MSPRYQNGNSFAQGMTQGLSFVGGMIDLLEHKENRERKFKREDAAELRKDKRLSFDEHTDIRQGDIHGLNMEGKQTQNDAAAYALDESKAGRGTRDVEREAKGLEAINRATFAKTKGQSGAFEPGGIGEKAFNSVFKNQINTADRSALALDIDQKTQGAKIKGINAAANLSESQANVQTGTEQSQIDFIETKLAVAEEQLAQLEATYGKEKLFETKEYGPLKLEQLRKLYAADMKALSSVTTINGGPDPRIKDFSSWLKDNLVGAEGPKTGGPDIPDPTGKNKVRYDLSHYEP